MTEENPTEWVIQTLNELITSLGLQSNYDKNPPVETLEDIKIRGLLDIFHILCNLPQSGEFVSSEDAGVSEVENMISYIKKRYGSKGNEFRYLSPYLISGKDPTQLKFLLQLFELLHDHKLISQKSSRGNSTSTSLTSLTNSSTNSQVSSKNHSSSNPNATAHSQTNSSISNRTATDNNSTLTSNSSGGSTINKVRVKVVNGSASSADKNSYKGTTKGDRTASPGSTLMSDSSTASTINKVKVNIVNGTTSDFTKGSSTASDPSSSMASTSSVSRTIDAIVNNAVEETLSKRKTNQPPKTTYIYKPKAQRTPDRLTSSKLEFDKEQMLMVHAGGPKNQEDTLRSVSTISTTGQAKPVLVESFNKQPERYETETIGHIHQIPMSDPSVMMQMSQKLLEEPIDPTQTSSGAPNFTLFKKPSKETLKVNSKPVTKTNSMFDMMVSGFVGKNTPGSTSPKVLEESKDLNQSSSSSVSNFTLIKKPSKETLKVNSNPVTKSNSLLGMMASGLLHQKVSEESKVSKQTSKMISDDIPQNAQGSSSSSQPINAQSIPVITIEDTDSRPRNSSEDSGTIAEIHIVQNDDSVDNDSQQVDFINTGSSQSIETFFEMDEVQGLLRNELDVLEQLIHKLKGTNCGEILSQGRTTNTSSFSEMNLPKRSNKKFPYYPYGIIYPKCKSIIGKPKPICEEDEDNLEEDKSLEEEDMEEEEEDEEESEGINNPSRIVSSSSHHDNYDFDKGNPSREGGSHFYGSSNNENAENYPSKGAHSSKSIEQIYQKGPTPVNETTASDRPSASASNIKNLESSLAKSPYSKYTLPTSSQKKFDMSKPSGLLSPTFPTEIIQKISRDLSKGNLDSLTVEKLKDIVQYYLNLLKYTEKDDQVFTNELSRRFADVATSRKSASELQRKLDEAEKRREAILEQKTVWRRIESVKRALKLSEMEKNKIESQSKAAFQKMLEAKRQDSKVIFDAFKSAMNDEKQIVHDLRKERKENAKKVYNEAELRLAAMQHTYATEIRNLRSQFTELKRNCSPETEIKLRAVWKESKDKMQKEIQKCVDGITKKATSVYFK